MAARIAFQRHAAPLTASLLVGSFALYPSVAHAEAPKSYQPAAKKPIYDYDLASLDEQEYNRQLRLLEQQNKARIQQHREAQEQAQKGEQQQQEVEAPREPEQTPQQHGPTPTDRLAVQIRNVRLFLYRQACGAEDAVNRTMDRAFHLEKSFTDTIAGLAPPAESGEKLMPGLVYVLVAAMAGSIVTRRSNILLRATVPAAFGVAMGWTAIPVTMTNVSELAWKYEQRFPVVAQGHLQTKEAWKQSISFARAHAQVGRNMVDEKVKTARETVEDWVRKGK